jgi:CheY-like chemotaxis protein
LRKRAADGKSSKLMPQNKGLIFVIDDDQGIRDAVGELLEMEGYSVLTAGNGQEGLAQLRSPPAPDLILLDMMMPGMDGLEFRDQQMAEKLCLGVPVVLMSAAHRLEERQKSAGLTDHLSKPMDISDLLDKIEKNIKR